VNPPVTEATIGTAPPRSVSGNRPWPRGLPTQPTPRPPLSSFSEQEAPPLRASQALQTRRSPHSRASQALQRETWTGGGVIEPSCQALQSLTRGWRPQPRARVKLFLISIPAQKNLTDVAGGVGWVGRPRGQVGSHWEERGGALPLRFAVSDSLQEGSSDYSTVLAHLPFLVVYSTVLGHLPFWCSIDFLVYPPPPPLPSRKT